MIYYFIYTAQAMKKYPKETAEVWIGYTICKPRFWAEILVELSLFIWWLA